MKLCNHIIFDIINPIFTIVTKIQEQCYYAVLHRIASYQFRIVVRVKIKLYCCRCLIDNDDIVVGKNIKKKKYVSMGWCFFFNFARLCFLYLHFENSKTQPYEIRKKLIRSALSIVRCSGYKLSHKIYKCLLYLVDTYLPTDFIILNLCICVMDSDNPK